SRMAKRDKKLRIVGKYGSRFGASLRKTVKKTEVTQHSTYTCTFCGAWVCSTTAAAQVRSAIRRLKKIKDI
ncbi:unnamed protein product, partial [Candidula unifasciata]